MADTFPALRAPLASPFAAALPLPAVRRIPHKQRLRSARFLEANQPQARSRERSPGNSPAPSGKCPHDRPRNRSLHDTPRAAVPQAFCVLPMKYSMAVSTFSLTSGATAQGREVRRVSPPASHCRRASHRTAQYARHSGWYRKRAPPRATAYDRFDLSENITNTGMGSPNPLCTLRWARRTARSHAR